MRELEDLAKPCSSLDEIRSMAARRLTLQEAAETAAQTAVMPRVRGRQQEHLNRLRYPPLPKSEAHHKLIKGIF